MEVPFIKPKSDQVKAGEAKAYNLVDTSGFLKPLNKSSFAAAKFTERFSGKESAPSVADHGGRSKGDPTVNIEDHIQFPAVK